MTNTFVFNPLTKPTYVMSKPIGSSCNLNCSYCYYLEKQKLYENRKSFQMSDEVLERYIENYINAQPVPEVLFTWHGGETLLRDINFYHKVIELQQRYGRGRRIDNSLQTNGVLLDDEWCRFFKANNFLIGISIDGDEHCHNVYRKNKGGQGTFKQVMKGIELLQKHNIEYNTLSVINDYNVNYPLETYRFLKQIGSRYMQFTPIVERFTQSRPDGLSLMSAGDSDDAELAPWTVNSIEFGKFYISIFDEWVRRDVAQYYVQLFDATLAGIVGQSPGVCIFGETCGHAAAMEFNGDVYACDHFVFPEHKLGNILTHSVYEMMFSDKQLKFGADKQDNLPSQCFSCEYLKLCNGECPKNRISKTANDEPNLNYLCAGYKAYFKHVKPYMEYMAEQLSKQQSPANVMSWIREQEKGNIRQQLRAAKRKN